MWIVSVTQVVSMAEQSAQRINRLSLKPGILGNPKAWK